MEPIDVFGEDVIDPGGAGNGGVCDDGRVTMLGN